ncbi:MAG TPA: hypothetical protein K8V95_07695, partial [Staphylococcus arlettae]|nr:hypothetical protein [Staphylococcus arlettae]
MNNLKITKEYNKLASDQHNIDIFNIYDNGREVLQYAIKYNQYNNMYDFYNLTDNKKITGLTYKKYNNILSKEIEYQ